jgi:uncharacterized protein YbcI
MVKKPPHEMLEEFNQAILHFEQDYFGHEHVQAYTYFIKDMILVRVRGILTPAEQKLAESRDGMFNVKDTRRQLFETARPFLEGIVRRVTGCRVISLHTDMSTSSGERIVLFIVDANLENA